MNCSKNGKEPTELVEVVRKISQCQVISYREINSNFRLGDNIDAIIISGSAFRITVASEKAQFDMALNFIKDCSMPILGICFGHQLLCLAFGARAESLNQEVHCFENVELVKTIGIFSNFEMGRSIPLAEHHNDYISIDSLDSAGFVLLAKSKSCEVEAVKHKTKPLYGVQFHPERITLKDETHPEGHRVIENFYRNVVR